MSPKLTMLKESVVFVAIVLVLTVIYNFAATPLSIIWGVFVGVEIHSESSFPLGHMARIYSKPGLGDQQLIFEVDDETVFKTGDWEPGNVKEEIEWDESGHVVSFYASNRKVFTFDTRSGIGHREY